MRIDPESPQSRVKRSNIPPSLSGFIWFVWTKLRLPYIF